MQRDHAEQRGSGARQAAQASVAAAQDAHTDQAALPLGQRALLVPQPHPGEAAPRPEEAAHVLALPAETVTPPPLRGALIAFSIVHLKFGDFVANVYMCIYIGGEKKSS